MTVDINNLILAGVAVHLLAALGKALFRAPRQQAQIDSIEGKVDAVIAAVSPQSPPAPNNGGAGEKNDAQGGR